MVHAPHDDESQPMLVPVSPAFSRMKCTSNVRGSTSWDTAAPLIFIDTCTDPPRRLQPSQRGPSPTAGRPEDSPSGTQLAQSSGRQGSEDRNHREERDQAKSRATSPQVR